MLSLLALAAAASQPDRAVAQVRATATATATVRILRPAPATKADWDRAPEHRKRDVIVIDADGEKRTIRIIEHE